MSKQDGRVTARQNELRLLKALHKFGWLRTRDIAALGWSPKKSSPPKGHFRPVIFSVSGSAIRMAQRTLRRLRESRQVFVHEASDGSKLYGLAEGGARTLRQLDIPAQSAKDWLRRFSSAQYQHRRIANEVAISAIVQGYRATTEHEIACGEWLGGMKGILGKKPDVLVRNAKSVWFCEIERSAKNKTQYTKLVSFLSHLWPDNHNLLSRANLPGEHVLEQVIFIANRPFAKKLTTDLEKLGWTDELINYRIAHISYLYVSEAKFINKNI